MVGSCIERSTDEFQNDVSHQTPYAEAGSPSVERMSWARCPSGTTRRSSRRPLMNSGLTPFWVSAILRRE